MSPFPKDTATCKTCGSPNPRVTFKSNDDIVGGTDRGGCLDEFHRPNESKTAPK